MKAYQVKLNPNKVAKSIAERIGNGEYKDLKETMSRLQEIANKLISNKNLSSNDLITLKLNGYLPHK